LVNKLFIFSLSVRPLFFVFKIILILFVFCLSVCLFVCLSVCQFVSLSVCQFVCLSVCLFVFLYVICDVFHPLLPHFYIISRTSLSLVSPTNKKRTYIGKFKFELRFFLKIFLFAIIVLNIMLMQQKYQLMNVCVCVTKTSIQMIKPFTLLLYMLRSSAVVSILETLKILSNFYFKITSNVNKNGLHRTVSTCLVSTLLNVTEIRRKLN